MADYKFVVGPGNISSDLTSVDISGTTFGVYSSMTQVLSGGTNGDSILTGLSVCIMLTETTIDLGYYSPFDGAAEQKDVVTNFIFTSSTNSPYVYTVFNSSNKAANYLALASYTINWGDNTPNEIFTGDTLSHNYPTTPSGYTITMRQTTPFGVNDVSKKITIPFTNAVIYNPLGRAFFTPLGGSWANTPVSYDYIFSGDAVNTVESEVSSGYTQVPFVVSGLTTSRITELALYGQNPYQVGVPVFYGAQPFGVITDINSVFTAYTIEDTNYYDYSDGTSIYFQNSSGFTSDMLTAVPITKDELLIKIQDQPQIITDVYVERGKNTVYQQIQRLGEVSTLSGLINYGYGYYTIENKG
jgi:hypothetical protein